MLTALACGRFDQFTSAATRDATVARCGGEVIGRSEEGRPIYGATVGRGPVRVSLISGNHADEPVGSETLRVLIDGSRSQTPEWAAEFTFVIVPHANPDGEARQAAWMERWPDPLAYWQRAFREKPGRDVEFGYPQMRPENRAVAAFLADHGPFAMHASLHGMAAATGGWHLIERSWVDRTAELRRQYAAAVRDAGLGLFDWDRGGEKGFDYIEPGFATTPRSDAMRQYFLERGDEATAALFHRNSMEWVRSLGGDPLCMVTELPLFRVSRADGPEPASAPGVPATYFAFREALTSARAKLEAGDAAAALAAVDRFSVRLVDIGTAVRLQLRAIELGLQIITEANRHGR